MKFSPKCRTKKLGMLYTILGSFCSFLNWEGGKGPIFGPKSDLGKSLIKRLYCKCTVKLESSANGVTLSR